MKSKLDQPRKIPTDYIADLNQSTDLVALIEDKTGSTAKRSGTSHKIKCCFHEDTHPSLVIYPNGSFYCFTCGTGGQDAIKFIQLHDKLNFPSAVAELAQRAGKPIPDYVEKSFSGTSISVIQSIFNDATQFYIENFKCNEAAYKPDPNVPADDPSLYPLSYMYEKRGFENLGFLEQQKIGVTSSKSSLLDYLKSTGKYSLDDLVASTLISKKDGRYYDYFGRHWGDRIIIPIRGRSGNTIGFTSRVFTPADEALAKDGKFGKYINTKEVPFFSKKSQWLDGIDRLSKSGGDILVVEGNIDRLQAVYHGYNAVAIGSANLSVEQINRLLLLTGYGTRGKIILCLDGDKAGREGSYRSVLTAFSQLHQGGSLWVASIPFAEGSKIDVDDVLRKQGRTAFDAIINSAVSATEYFRQHIIKSIGIDHPENDPQFQTSVIRTATDALSDVDDAFKKLIIKYVTPQPTKAVVDIPADKNWEAELIRNPPTKAEKIEGLPGKLISNEYNVKQILMNDDRWRGSIGFNSFSKKMEKLTPRFMPIPQSDESTTAWVDADDYNATAWLNKEYALNVRQNLVSAAIGAVAIENCFHPVRDYLDGLCWDGTPRIATWLHDYLLGSQNPEYLALVGKIWLLSAVARIYKPGCKVDTVPILEGNQGAMKSSAIESLCPDEEWYTDTVISLATRDAYASLPGIWLFELPELTALSGGRQARFINKYEKHPVTYPRQCVFVGTTNQNEYLRDETGNRRFLPIRCGENNEKLKVDKLRKDRDQLWAEAVHLFKSGEKWWASGEDEESLLLAEQQGRLTTIP